MGGRLICTPPPAWTQIRPQDFAISSLYGRNTTNGPGCCQAATAWRGGGSSHCGRPGEPISPLAQERWTYLVTERLLPMVSIGGELSPAPNRFPHSHQRTIFVQLPHLAVAHIPVKIWSDAHERFIHSFSLPFIFHSSKRNESSQSFRTDPKAPKDTHESAHESTTRMRRSVHAWKKKQNVLSPFSPSTRPSGFVPHKGLPRGASWWMWLGTGLHPVPSHRKGRQPMGRGTLRASSKGDWGRERTWEGGKEGEREAGSGWGGE